MICFIIKTIDFTKNEARKTMNIKCNVLPKEYYVVFPDGSEDIIEAESVEKARLIASAKYNVSVENLKFKLKTLSII